jgi:hypothetical protein
MVHQACQSELASYLNELVLRNKAKVSLVIANIFSPSCRRERLHLIASSNIHFHPFAEKWTETYLLLPKASATRK